MITEHTIDRFELSRKKGKLADSGKIDISIDGMTSKKDGVEIRYTFTIVYANDSGKLLISGIIRAKEKDGVKIVEEWKKSKKLPDPLAGDLFNHTANLNRLRAAAILRALDAKMEMTEERPDKPAA
jgi:hypothetical protein